jgi:hypothetical protein
MSCASCGKERQAEADRGGSDAGPPDPYRRLCQKGCKASSAKPPGEVDPGDIQASGHIGAACSEDWVSAI